MHFGFCVMLLAAASRSAAPENEEKSEAPPAGLLAVYRPAAGGNPIRRIEPLPRLFGPGTPHPGLAPGFDASWTGMLLIPRDAAYTFAVRQSGLRNLKVMLAGKLIALGEPVELSANETAMEISLRAAANDAVLELYWKSPYFIEERIGPRFFAHVANPNAAPAIGQQKLIEEGATLAEAFGCFRCHEAPTGWSATLAHNLSPAVQLPGPRLGGMEHRLHRAWLAEWLNDPHQTRPDARMPAVLNRSPAAQAAAKTIVAYLTAGQSESMAAAKPPGSASAGKTLFQSSGCAACHEPWVGNKADESLRLPIPVLDGLARKWTGAGFAEFLKAPGAYRPHGRMPDFSLSPAQAADLAGYLLTRDKAGAPPAFVGLPKPADSRAIVLPRSAVTFHYNEDVFKPTLARFVRFTITATSGGEEPGIDELEIYGADATKNLAPAGVATASSELPNHEIHKIRHLNDGKTGNEHSWIGNERGRGWVQIELPKPAEVRKVVWARERSRKVADRLAVSYRIETSLDGKQWAVVCDSTDRAPFGTDSETLIALMTTDASLFGPDELRRQWQSLGERAEDFDQLRHGIRLQAVALRQMAAVGCLNCHDADGQTLVRVDRRASGAPTLAIGAKPPAGRPLFNLPAEALSRGCLGPSEMQRKAPRFAFSAAQREALTAFVSSLQTTDKSLSTAESARIELRLLNCTACHRNESAGGEPLTMLLGGSEAARWISPPDLTGVASRLRPERLNEYLREGTRHHRLRPWVGARMPGFGERGGRLAVQLMARDGASGPALQAASGSFSINKPTILPGHVDLGRFIVGRKALACTNCHRFNEQEVVGQVDPTTRGPDLGMVADHIRHDYFQRLLRDPSRIYPGTKMPQNVRLDGSVPIPALAKLPRDLPMEALWNYLSLGTAAPRPVEEETTVLPANLTQPVVQRGLTFLDKRSFPRGMSLGFASGTVLWDADQLGPAAAWFGGFVTSRPEHYFGLDWRPSASKIETFPDRPCALVFRYPGHGWQAAPLPLESDPNDGARFDGYVVHSKSVELRYRLPAGSKPVLVTERLRVENRPAWHGFARDFSVTGLPETAQVGIAATASGPIAFFGAGGKPAPIAATGVDAPVATYRVANELKAVRANAGPGAIWEVQPSADRTGSRLILGAPPAGNRPTQLRIDWWSYQGRGEQASADELASLSNPALLAFPAEKLKEAARPPATTVTPATPPLSERPFGYRLESLPPPLEGWRPGGVAFTDDGMMYAVSMTEGKVFRAKIPPRESPKSIPWKLFASGLNHPIGIVAVAGRIYVSQKPELTELIDHDGDGMVDEYRSVMGPWGLSFGFHEYAFGLAVDPEQRLYVALNTGYFWTNPGYVNPGRFRGSVLRVDRAGKIEEFARGFRVPNGIAPGPNGDIFVCDNQGDWIQVCKIAHVQQGKFFGHPETKADALPPGQYPGGKAACWLPYQYCRSAAGPVTDPSNGEFGPFQGQIFVGDVGYGNNPGIMRVALEKVDGEYQGACFRFLEDEPRGPNRLDFGPDHALYISSLTSGLTRLRYGGLAPLEVHHMTIRPGGEGFIFHFTKPLAGDLKLAPDSLRVRRWNYLYSGNYGSPQENETDVPVRTMQLSADRRELIVGMSVQTHPIGMHYYFNLGKLRAVDGSPLAHAEAWYTVNRIPRR